MLRSATFIAVFTFIVPIALAQTKPIQMAQDKTPARESTEAAVSAPPAPARQSERLRYPDMMSAWEYAPQEWK